MRIGFSIMAVAGLALLVGCAGPEKKFGRGLSNVTEFTRLGEIRRSMEQTALWDSVPDAYTTGFVRGFNRSLVRTAVGAYEIVTAPLPPYGPLFTPKQPVFPDYSVATTSYPWGGLALPETPGFPQNYVPNLLGDGTWATDGFFGFAGGDILPMVPGSRFHVFDN